MPPSRTGKAKSRLAPKPAIAPAVVATSGETIVRERFARQGLMRLIGAWLDVVEPGRVVIEVPFSERLGGDDGHFHAAIASALADTAGSYAVLSQLADKSSIVTVEYKINFLRPAGGQRLRAEARVLRLGRSLSVAQTDISVVSNSEASIIGLMQATYLRIAPAASATKANDIAASTK